MQRLTIHGARGSHPTSGRQYCRYGGHTPCVSFVTERQILLFDAGTGISAISDVLAARATLPPITVFFTHFHLDHVIGLPAFTPFYRARAHVTLRGDPKAGAWAAALRTLAGPPFWPVNPFAAGATVRFNNLPSAGRLRLDGLTISWCLVWHPQRCLSYRIDTPTHSVVLATDREHGQAKLDAAFLKFCRGADILIHDAQYTPQEYPRRRGWGHSTWEHAAQTARTAEVRQLILTSHDPGHADEEMDGIVRKARRIFRNTRAAAENLVVISEE